jgi:hypothetical protein
MNGTDSTADRVLILGPGFRSCEALKVPGYGV